MLVVASNICIEIRPSLLTLRANLSSVRGTISFVFLFNNHDAIQTIIKMMDQQQQTNKLSAKK